MRVSDFDFELPDALIAQHPLAQRTASRLLCLGGHGGALVDRQFSDLPSLLRAGDLLVFNNTRVIPARLFGVKPTGGKVEVLVERVINEHRALAHVRASIAPKVDTHFDIDGGVRVTVVGRADDLFELRFEDPRPVLEILNAMGHIPLPPYIARADEMTDRERYQTVYAQTPGAVAAPTAGLHFDEPLLKAVQAIGVDLAYVTLHVGTATFQPVRVDDIKDHRMHAEIVDVAPRVCDQVRAARARGGRVIAVGTTSVRSLEAASQSGGIQPFHGDTRLFITPGYSFRSVDALITNFHLPRSTLLMLVCAFGGYGPVMQAYRHAVERGYRFFSYGDAMFLSRDWA